MRTTVARWTCGVVILGLLSGCDGDGAVGAEALVSLGEEPAGKNCPTGGTSIESGRDTNQDGELDRDEVESTFYSCNGADGADGPAGEAEAGPAGADGRSALVVSSPEEPGEVCAAGGQRIDQGIDTDEDGELSAAEILSTATVCSGLAGDAGTDGKTALINVTEELAGANCATGGEKLESGIDANDDGTLGAAEITKTAYICDGSQGGDALDGLSSVTTEAAGGNCASGGLRLDLGLDEDGSGALEAGEIDTTSYLCNGEDGDDGLDGLVAVEDEPAGANCAAGGEKITYGRDADANGSLDASEVAGVRYVCDGAAGADGVDALVKVTQVDPGAVCTFGGQQIDSGRDDDDDGALDAGEIENTTYVCNGSP